MHRKLHPCSWHWSTERAQFFSAAMPDRTFAQPKLPKLNELGYEVLPHLSCSPDLLPTGCPFFQTLTTFCSRQPAGGRKCFPRVHQILKHGFFLLQEQTNLFLFCKNVLIVMVPILLNKYVFEPSYNH